MRVSRCSLLLRGAAALASVGSLVTGVCGCRVPQAAPPYRTIFLEATRQSEAAQAANERGLTFAVQGNYDAAEEAFREAVRADLSYAAGHNNLGLVLLNKRRFYESALEFSFAMKLDPRAIEPVINLGRLYETVGWYRAATREYEKALPLAPENAEAMGRLAYVYARCGVDTDKARSLLERLARREEGGEWQQWALARLEGQVSLGAR